MLGMHMLNRVGGLHHVSHIFTITLQHEKNYCPMNTCHNNHFTLQ